MKKFPESKWKDPLDKIFKSQSKEDLKFSPSKAQVTYLMKATSRLNEASEEVRVISKLAHDNLIHPREAQRMLSYQVMQIKRTLREIERYVEPIELEEY